MLSYDYRCMKKVYETCKKAQSNFHMDEVIFTADVFNF